MKETIAVIGLGKLGLCTAACLAAAGYKVFGFDSNTGYVKVLTNRHAPFYEAGLQELLDSTRDNLHFCETAAEALEEASISFIIVPTPSLPDGAFDNSFIHQALVMLVPALKEKTSFHIVNIVSTVMPGSCRNDFIPYLEKASGKKAGCEFGLAYNPEFIAIGSVIADFTNPDIVLIGETDRCTGDRLEKIYEKTCRNSPYMARTSLLNAEIAKLALNCFCTMKISFANQLASICDTIPGTDAARICEIIGRDSRIGGKYIKPGLGFGGPCFPRDNEAFIRFAAAHEASSSLQEAVVKINNMQPGRIAGKIAAMAEEHGRRIALLGLAYKPGTYLTERSQALEIANYLANEHPDMELTLFDPLAKAPPGPWQQTESLKKCVEKADVIAVLTPWEEFRTLRRKYTLKESCCILDFWQLNEPASADSKT